MKQIKFVLTDVKFWRISELIWQCFNIAPLFSFYKNLVEVLEKTRTKHNVIRITNYLIKQLNELFCILKTKENKVLFYE
jgi:fatty acid-binding protein DegV